jgi:hypothetical protein
MAEKSSCRNEVCLLGNGAFCGVYVDGLDHSAELCYTIIIMRVYVFHVISVLILRMSERTCVTVLRHIALSVLVPTADAKATSRSKLLYKLKVAHSIRR